MKTALLTIGNELLGGFTIDTNAAWLGQALLAGGAEVAFKVSVGDSTDDIGTMLGELDGLYELIITTGGLGPTSDDITKGAVCQYFESEIKFDEAYWQVLIDRFAKRGFTITDNNRSQAEIPVKATILPNPVGTAPGLKFISDQKSTFIILPGVPREMKAIINEHVLPMLPGVGRPYITLHTAGIIESALAERVEPILAGLAVGVAYLPDYTGVDLRLTSSAVGFKGQSDLDAAVSAIRGQFDPYIWGIDDETLSGVVGQALRDRGDTIGVAESCSGGLLGSTIINEPGSSNYFMGSIVAYSDKSKIELLEVGPDKIKLHGAVSEEIAMEMATGAKKAFDTQWSIGTTGLSGPDGGSDEKPIGLVYIAVAGPNRIKAKKYRLVPDRLHHKRATVAAALNMLRKEIQHHG